MDIPTLNGGVGKLRELDSNDLEHIKAAQQFFDELFNETLTVIDGSLTPTGVYNKVKTIMEDYGKTDRKTNHFEYHKENSKMIVLLYIDNLDNLITENDTFGSLDTNGVKKKMYDYIVELKKLYNLTSIIVAPSKPMMTRVVRETEPSYKETGIFGANCDLAIVMYNPYHENNNNYCHYPIEDLVINGKNRFRTATIVRNTNGITGVGVGLIFVGECGYIAEAPSSNDLDGFNRIIKLLKPLH